MISRGAMESTFFVLTLSCAASACTQSDEPAVDSSESSLRSGGDYYLRCRSRGWRMDNTSKFDIEAGGFGSLSYDASRSKSSHPDECIVSKTQRRRGDGRNPIDYSTRSTLKVPGQVLLSRVSRFRPFPVIYPRSGKYTALLDTSNWTLSVAPAAPAAQIFSSIEGFGTTANYRPHTPSRWSVAADRGDIRYFLDATGYPQGPNGTLGEYSLYAPETYGDFVFRMTARSNEDPTANAHADFAVVFGYLNSENYSFISFSNSTADTRLVRVEGGQPMVVAAANRAGIVDSEYHSIQVWRHGYWIRALVDQQEILSVNDTVKEPGKVGVGSLDDAAFFDDISATSYDSISTPHYALSLPSEQRAHQGAVTSILENAYAVYLSNTGWDINARMGHARYDYRYRPSGWRWFDDANGCCELGGGLTISGGPSVVLGDLIPQSELPASDGFNLFTAISLHELGNGWFLPGVTLPEWVEWLRSESHSGFLRAEGELDLGYCADANREHTGHYADYLSTSLDNRRLFGSSVEPLLVSIRERYGWGVFRAVYDAALAGKLDYLGNLPSSDRDNEMDLFLSRAAKEDLSPVLERELGVVVRDDVRRALQDLPASTLTVLETLPCHPSTFHVTPSPIEVTAGPTGADTTTKLYAQAPADWTVRLASPAPWVSVARDGTSQATTVTLTFHTAVACPGARLQTALVFESPAIAEPLSVPVVLQMP